MTQLEQNLIQIKNEKDTKILPENIKEGVHIFDVVGTYRGVIQHNVVYNTEIISTDTSKVYVSTNIDSKFIRIFKGYCFKLIGSTLYCYNMTTTGEIAHIDCEIQTSNNTMIDAGCYNCFGDNTILVVVTDSTQFKYYIFDTLNNIFEYKNTISETSSVQKFPALNPERPIIIYSNQKNVDKNASYGIVRTINSDFTHTHITNMRITTGQQSGSHVMVTRWINRNIFTQNNEQVDWSSSEQYQSWGCYTRQAEQLGYFSENNTFAALKSLGAWDYVCDANYSSTLAIYCVYNTTTQRYTWNIYRLIRSATGIITLGERIYSYTEVNQVQIVGNCYFITDNIFYCNGLLYKINGNNVEIIGNSDVIPYHRSRGNILYRNSAKTELYTYLALGNSRVSSVTVDEKTFYNIDDGSNIGGSGVLSGNILYDSTGRIVGSMPNNGQLNYTPSTSQQTIPAGYTSGGTIEAISISEQEYQEDLDLANDILGID